MSCRSSDIVAAKLFRGLSPHCSGALRASAVTFPLYSPPLATYYWLLPFFKEHQNNNPASYHACPILSTKISLNDNKLRPIRLWLACPWQVGHALPAFVAGVVTTAEYRPERAAAAPLLGGAMGWVMSSGNWQGRLSEASREARSPSQPRSCGDLAPLLHSPRCSEAINRVQRSRYLQEIRPPATLQVRLVRRPNQRAALFHRRPHRRVRAKSDIPNET